MRRGVQTSASYLPGPQLSLRDTIMCAGGICFLPGEASVKGFLSRLYPRSSDIDHARLTPYNEAKPPPTCEGRQGSDCLDIGPACGKPK